MDQKQEKANTPTMVEPTMLGMSRERMAAVLPNRKNIHQHFLLKWYSAQITMGWNSPIQTKVAMPMNSPEKFNRIYLWYFLTYFLWVLLNELCQTITILQKYINILHITMHPP
jgi:hypothetical protein